MIMETGLQSSWKLGADPEIPEHVHIVKFNSKSWRIDVVVVPKYAVYRKPWYFSGFIHCFAEDDESCKVIRFDVSAEVFRVMKFPNVEDHTDTEITMSVYKEHAIGYIHHNFRREGDIDIWVMKEYGNVDSFTNVSRIMTYPNYRQCFFLPPLRFRKNGEICMHMYWDLPVSSLFIDGFG